MVSLAVFSVLAAGAYATLNGVAEASRIVAEQMSRLQALQRTVQRLSLDFAQLVPRPVRDELGDGRLASLDADARNTDLVELTRGGWPNPLVLPRPTLQRVAYRLEDDKLVRRQWPVLDRTLDADPAEATLLEDIEEIRLRFLTDGDDWVLEWPPENQSGSLGLSLRPRAVEVVLVITELGEIRRVIEVTG